MALNDYGTNLRKSDNFPGLFTPFTEPKMGFFRAVASIPACPVSRLNTAAHCFINTARQLVRAADHLVDLQLRSGLRAVVVGAVSEAVATVYHAAMILVDLAREVLAMITRSIATFGLGVMVASSAIASGTKSAYNFLFTKKAAAPAVEEVAAAPAVEEVKPAVEEVKPAAEEVKPAAEEVKTAAEEVTAPAATETAANEEEEGFSVCGFRFY